MDRPRRPTVESLETRRLLTADLNFGSSTLTGDVFKPGGSATLNAYVRNFGDLHVTAQFAVQFKYARVDFRADADNVSFDDPAAVVLSSVNVDDDIFIGSVGKQLRVPLTFPGDLAPGRYVLMGKLDSANALLETLESNNIKVFGAGRAFAGDGSLTIPGTPGDDSLSIAATATGHRVTVNGYVEDFTPDKVSSFYVAADAGDDLIVASGVVPNFRADGQDGNDKLVGSDGNDTLIGGAGKDTLFGGIGNDRLNGNGGHDRLFGESGSDRLYGYAGNDLLDGSSSSDRLEGGAGLDTMFGQGGNDRFFTRDGEIDELYGASGNDQGEVDVTDVRSSIDTVLP